MSKKPLLSESQVAKWMKLANIDKNATENFLTENKKNKKVLKEMYGGASYARKDEPEEMGMGGEEVEDMGDMGMGDGSMDEEPSVMEPEGEEMEMGGEEGELEFDSVDDLKQVLADAMGSEEAKDAIKAAVMDALQDLGLADEMGGDEEDMDLGMEGGDEGGDEPAEPAEEEENLEEGIEVLTDDEVINEVLKRVIRRLV